MTNIADISNSALLNASFNAQAFEKKAKQHAQSSLAAFKKTSRNYSLFNIGFFSLFFLELLCFLAFFPFFAKSTLLAFSLASLFLTGFSYFVLIFYFQAKKPEQFYQLRAEFANACRLELPMSADAPESHLLMAHAAKLFAHLLTGKELEFYPHFPPLYTIDLLMKKFSIWSHWRDVHKMKELLLFLAINEQVQWIKIHPTDLEAHASLADTYTSLYKLYQDPQNRGEEWIWTPPAYASEEMQQKFKHAAERAIEELTILDDYSPNDAWVQAQLAAAYHDLELPVLEIQAYEKILRSVPHDRQVFLRLGILYFQQGQTAKGLKLYEQLKKAKDPKAEDLIAYYDASSSFD